MRNYYEIRDNTVAIKLKNNKGIELETLIDLEDLEKVKKLGLVWHLSWDKVLQQYYCSATKYLGVIDGKPNYKTILLHRVIMSGENKHVDHLNHDTLDNRKSNLVVKSVQDNAFNRKGANRNSTTGVRNVCYDKKNNKYLVQLQINGKNTLFGRFDNLEDAKRCAEENRNKYYPKVNIN